MTKLKTLKINGVRNLDSVSVTLAPKVTLFCGQNGSGKTSILESVSLLGLGRSFRSPKIRSLINHGLPSLTVFSDVMLEDNNKSTVGIEKSRGGNSTIRINRDNAKSSSELARLLPLQIINADSFDLIEGSPTLRRQFMDWLVFHVKHDFIHCWRRLQRVTKQRNSLLRHDKIQRSDLDYWDQEFVLLSEQVDAFRRDVFEEFQVHLRELIDKKSLTFLKDLELTYLRGWPEEQALQDILVSDFDRDKRDGFTHHGPHRSDIQIKTQEGYKASDILSRGQEKLCVCALHVAQAQFFTQVTGHQCVFLIDDLLAELDSTNAIQLAKWLIDIDTQVLVTGINSKELSHVWDSVLTDPNDRAMFHVEQGFVKPQ